MQNVRGDCVDIDVKRYWGDRKRKLHFFAINCFHVIRHSLSTNPEIDDLERPLIAFFYFKLWCHAGMSSACML